MYIVPGYKMSYFGVYIFGHIAQPYKACIPLSVSYKFSLC